MRKKDEKKLVVSLDIGTSKVVAIIASISMQHEIEIIGVGWEPSKGLKKGVVVDIESTIASIQKAVEKAEKMAGCQAFGVYAGIAGAHIRSLNSNGIVAIKDNEVSEEDIDRVIDAAQAVAIPTDQKLLHILPQEYIIDGQGGIRDPIGMSGVRLEAKVHMVTCAASAVQNIEKCIRRCGLEVDDIILQQLASSSAVLTEDEQDLGVCLCDIGGGTTDIAVYIDGTVHHSAAISIAGDQVTNDIAIALTTPTKDAEDLKIRFACALTQLADANEQIEVPSVGDKPPRTLTRQTLAEVVEPRYEELFTLIYDELERAGMLSKIGAGIVLTGGGSKLSGALELAEEIFNMPVRLAIPHKISGLKDVVRNPIYSTGIGLILFGNDPKNNSKWISESNHRGSLFYNFKNWFHKNF
ncbi:MAG: cell division protein FtsA [Methylococcaceae bacterium TMED69]|nr:MAG: cell division protein FtsA [Methylococcaceae bacterium TMED69]